MPTSGMAAGRQSAMMTAHSVRRTCPVRSRAARCPGQAPADSRPRGSAGRPAVRHFLAAEIPVGRWAEPANAALLLTDPASRYLTGVILPVDGGWTAH